MNRPMPFPMQPLGSDAPDALRLAWYKAERAWKLWQVRTVELAATRASRAPHSTEQSAVMVLQDASDRMRASLAALLEEYQLTALSTMDGATQRTA